jgi:hypothetical protein
MTKRPWSDKIWFSPCYVINELSRAVVEGDKKVIDRLMEAWICAMAMIYRAKSERAEYWIQLPPRDPPDVLAMKLVPTEDGSGNQLSELKVEVFELSEFDQEPVEVSIERKLRDKDYSGMMVIGFVRRFGGFNHVDVASHIQNLRPKAGSVSLLVQEDVGTTSISLIQLFPDRIKVKFDYGEFCKSSNQRDFVEMSRGTKARKEDSRTNDRMTVVP